MDHFAMLVAQHLKLDVPGMLEKFLRVHVRRAKSLLRLTTGCLVGGQQFILLAHHPHAPAPSPRRSLDNQRKPPVCPFLRELPPSRIPFISTPPRRGAPRPPSGPPNRMN